MDEAPAPMSVKLRHWRDRIALLTGGLSPRSRVVTPLVPDQRYQMHLSRALFACRWAPGKSVLEFGCGTGFSAHVLLEAGAQRVLGIEEYDRPIRHAERRYGSDRAAFRTGNLAAPSSEYGRHGLVLAMDVLSRYEQAEAVLRLYADHVEDGGTLVAGVPLARDKQDILAARRSGARTVLYPWYWASFFDELFEATRVFRHCAPVESLNWDEPSPAPFDARDFRFEEEEAPQALPNRAGIAAFFVASKPRGRLDS